MALRGQRFELDLNADDFTPLPIIERATDASDGPSAIGEIKERDPVAAPAPPKLKASRTGFPEHKRRSNVSAFKEQKTRQHASFLYPSQQEADPSSQPLPSPSKASDQAIAH